MATVDLSSLGRTVGLIAAAAVGVPAAVLAYHRQRALDTANRTAASQHEHKVQADHREHRTGVERHLRERYTTCAEQLGHDNSAIRLAGVYALASLADDWREFGNDSERQVCIDLLCAYLRTRRQPPAGAPGQPEGDHSGYGGEEQQVRVAIIGLIRSRTQRHGAQWTRCQFDLSGANLTGADLTEADLYGANLTDADLTEADLAGATLTDAYLYGAILTNVNLVGANLAGANLISTDLTEAELSEAHLFGTDLTGATLIRADLTDATLTGADLTAANLTDANLTAANLVGANLTHANLTDAYLLGANLENCRYSKMTRWPEGFVPPPFEQVPSPESTRPLASDSA